jgi:hypothetical protein
LIEQLMRSKWMAMCRLCRRELFTPKENANVHVMNRTVRRCFLFGEDEVTGRNYDYRKDWLEMRMDYLASSRSQPVGLGYVNCWTPKSEKRCNIEGRSDRELS